MEGDREQRADSFLHLHSADLINCGIHDLYESKLDLLSWQCVYCITVGMSQNKKIISILPSINMNMIVYTYRLIPY
jgi:hypothetical protein